MSNQQGVHIEKWIMTMVNNLDFINICIFWLQLKAHVYIYICIYMRMLWSVSNAELWCFHCCLPEQAVEQTVDLMLISDIMTRDTNVNWKKNLSYFIMIFHVLTSCLDGCGLGQCWLPPPPPPPPPPSCLDTDAGLANVDYPPTSPNFSEILIKIPNISFKEMHLKISYVKWWPFCHFAEAPGHQYPQCWPCFTH